MKNCFFLFLSILFLMPCNMAGHEKSKLIRNVRGEYAITATSNISPAEAKEKARENAKMNALIQAFGQQISISERIETSSAGDSFNSISILHNNGEIENFSIVKEGVEPHPNRNAELQFYCVADVKVRKGIDPDPSFTATISGIHSSYVNYDFFSFSITPTKDAYLKIFCFENSEIGYYLYPGGIHHGLLLKADTPIKLPRRNDPNIQLFTDKLKETNTLVFLLTKEEYPFNNANPTRQDIDKFIVHIPNNQKYVSYHVIDIMKR